MKRFLPIVAGLVVGATVTAAANLPNISGAQWAEASQIVGTLNALINQMNGGTGYSGTAQTVSLGVACTGTSATTTVVCTGQRGVASYTGVATISANTNATFIITATGYITTASNCTANFGLNTFAANSAPVITSVTPTANTLTILVGNASTTATGASQAAAIMFQ
jgi:hypothetical protein